MYFLLSWYSSSTFIETSKILIDFVNKKWLGISVSEIPDNLEVLLGAINCDNTTFSKKTCNGQYLDPLILHI